MDMTNLIAPLAIGGITGLMIVLLVLKNFAAKLKLKITIAAFLSAAIVAMVYYVLQNIVTGVILGTSWALAWLFIIAEYGIKTIPNMNLKNDPLELIEENASNLAGLLIAAIAFILGISATLFKNPGDKFNLVAFAAPPLISAISMGICTYFATKYSMTNDFKTKQYYLKRSLIWWDIGQTIFIATTLTMIIFVGMSIEKIIM
ncbi:MAG: hypothetical protein V1836_02520 [Candidatus Aenigmatarchaeota archaeon]